MERIRTYVITLGLVELPQHSTADVGNTHVEFEHCDSLAIF